MHFFVCLYVLPNVILVIRNYTFEFEIGWIDFTKKFFLRKSVKKGNNEQSHKCIRKTLFLRSIVALFLPIFQRLEDELQKTLAEFQEKVSIVFEKSGVTTSPDYVFCFRLASLLEE